MFIPAKPHLILSYNLAVLKREEMKKPFMLIAASLLLLASCNQNKTQTANTETTTPAESKNVDIKLAELGSPKDFACGMDLAEGEIADTMQYDGKVYGFCSKECKAEFAKDPQQHLSNPQ